jgi:enediyne biosynthesis protein E5
MLFSFIGLVKVTNSRTNMHHWLRYLDIALKRSARQGSEKDDDANWQSASLKFNFEILCVKLLVTASQYKAVGMQFDFFKDARYFQIIFQSVFLSYGIFYLHWNSEWGLYATYFGISICTQLACEIVFKKNTSAIFSTGWWMKFKTGIPSALISAFGLSLLLKTNHVEIAALAAFVSIISKYIIRVKGKHIFNPSALGITTAIFFTNDAWISTGQWGSNAVLFFGILCLGIIVVTRVQKLDLSLAFLATFILLLFARQIIFLGWPLDFFVQSISTGSLLLFSFFMITDPKTTPNHSIARIIWATGIAVVAFYLATFQFMSGAPVWVLVFAQPFVPVLDKFFKGKLFEWKPALNLAAS